MAIFFDEFNDDSIDVGWSQNTGTDGAIAEAGTDLTITAGDESFTTADITWLYQGIASSEDFDVEVEVTIGTNDGLGAGLILRTDVDNFACIYIIYSEGDYTGSSCSHDVGGSNTNQGFTGAATMRLRISRVGSTIQCYYYNAGWQSIAPATPYTTSGATSIGIFASDSANADATFDYFRDNDNKTVNIDDSVVISESITISELDKRPSTSESLTIAESVDVDLHTVLFNTVPDDGVSIRESVAVELNPYWSWGTQDTDLEITGFEIDAVGNDGLAELEITGFEIDAESTELPGGDADLSITGFEMYAEGSAEAELFITGFDIEGEGTAEFTGSAELTIRGFDITASGWQTPIGSAELFINGFSIDALGVVNSHGEAELTIRGFALTGYGTRIDYGIAELVMPKFVLDAAGTAIGDGDAAMNITGFSITAFGGADTGFDDTVLQHQRGERFST